MNEHFIVLDTETTNDLDCPFIYDLGFAVVDKWGSIYETHSYAIADIFLDKDLMASAYYAQKIPKYWEEIKAGKRKLITQKTAKKILRETCEKWNVKLIFAHNAIFDWKSCTYTQRYLTCSKYRYFFPYGVQLCDTLKMARKILTANDDYVNFCVSNNYLTKNNQVRLTAEIIYRYLMQNIDFEEEHTGLEDVLIEKEILAYCFQNDHDFNGYLWGDQ